jgi:hypothetical protein
MQHGQPSAPHESPIPLLLDEPEQLVNHDCSINRAPALPSIAEERIDPSLRIRQVERDKKEHYQLRA